MEDVLVKTTGSNKPRRPRRAFTPEFKAEIVEQCQAERDAGNRDDGGLSSGEKTELAALRRENRRLREDVGILKRACELLQVSRSADYNQRMAPARSRPGRAGAETVAYHHDPGQGSPFDADEIRQSLNVC
ncbi:hypothetical protein SAMN05216188_110144 [Lentzea xinjiangensis]|uniref:Transposase n=1 Tax=Lentzea xinjiangensis TaxID=402600 RepID=A0A1H9NCP4_9PSEU|nr:hypothetical protein SAMN05216188_110144 [Lentzea xinjiangensis]